MSIDAAARAVYASLLGSLLGIFEANSGLEGPSGAVAWTFLSLAEIVRAPLLPSRIQVDLNGILPLLQPGSMQGV